MLCPIEDMKSSTNVSISIYSSYNCDNVFCACIGHWHIINATYLSVPLKVLFLYLLLRSYLLLHWSPKWFTAWTENLSKSPLTASCHDLALHNRCIVRAVARILFLKQGPKHVAAPPCTLLLLQAIFNAWRTPIIDIVSMRSKSWDITFILSLDAPPFATCSSNVWIGLFNDNYENPWLFWNDR